MMTWKSHPWFFDRWQFNCSMELDNVRTSIAMNGCMTKQHLRSNLEVSLEGLDGLVVISSVFQLCWPNLPKLQRINLGFLHANDIAECRCLACCRRSWSGDSPQYTFSGRICFWSTVRKPSLGPPGLNTSLKHFDGKKQGTNGIASRTRTEGRVSGFQFSK